MIAQNSLVQNKWAKSPYCKLLLRMNGTNDGTTFLDESPSPKTITVNGNVCTKTAVKRFGNAYLYLDGVLIATQAKTANTPSSSNATTPLQIGFSYTGYYMYGYVDEMAIWNTIVPISDLYPVRAPLYDYAISEWSGQ